MHDVANNTVQSNTTVALYEIFCTYIQLCFEHNLAIGAHYEKSQQKFRILHVLWLRLQFAILKAMIDANFIQATHASQRARVAVK